MPAAFRTSISRGELVFDHRPPLALRAKGDNANDPDRLVAICTICNKRKTPRDIREIARLSDWHIISTTSPTACATRCLDDRCRRSANGANWCTASKDLSVDALDAADPISSGLLAGA